jgi:hypothetical protein
VGDGGGGGGRLVKPPSQPTNQACGVFLLSSYARNIGRRTAIQGCKFETLSKKLAKQKKGLRPWLKW